jgi:hypothetical protein
MTFIPFLYNSLVLHLPPVENLCPRKSVYESPEFFRAILPGSERPSLKTETGLPETRIEPFDVSQNFCFFVAVVEV